MKTNLKNRIGRIVTFILTLTIIMSSIGFNSFTVSAADATPSAPPIELPQMPNFKNTDPIRFFEGDNITVKSFVNPISWSSSMHILSSEKGNVIVDPGYYDDEVREYINSIGTIDAILLTHCHWDHIKGLNQLKQEFPNAKVYIHELDKEGLYDASLNFSQDNAETDAFVIDCEVNGLSAGKHNIAGYDVEVIHTPGHSPGSSLFYISDQNVLFVGDTLVFVGITRYDLPTSNIMDLYESIERIGNFKIPQETEVFFGHGERLSFNKMKNTYPCFTNPVQLSVKTKEDTVIPVTNPYFDGQTIKLPLRLIAEATGAKVDWDSGNMTATINFKNGKVIKAQIGNENVLVNNMAVKAEAVTSLYDGKTYVSGELIVKEFDNDSEWILTTVKSK